MFKWPWEKQSFGALSSLGLKERRHQPVKRQLRMETDLGQAVACHKGGEGGRFQGILQFIFVFTHTHMYIYIQNYIFLLDLTGVIWWPQMTMICSKRLTFFSSALH